MSEERKPLLAQLKDTVEFFSKRKTVGRMKTEHSIFIPSELMLNQAEETEAFIIAARAINKNTEFNCPVIVEQQDGLFKGLEFVFQFSPETKFSEIISFIEAQL